LSVILNARYRLASSLQAQAADPVGYAEREQDAITRLKRGEIGLFDYLLMDHANAAPSVRLSGEATDLDLDRLLADLDGDGI
jgi:hypothetical protein